eukprot:TRINITY_DN38898_c0_g1_i1.p1 TRINITY_DN38898_c0_g1~~TRINITY_DN38898_c0_g1_i1.p1  ORF type:complete len:133 (-),score=47.43 TRINITY_DN38898_c0_g1_i1:214-612(-)
MGNIWMRSLNDGPEVTPVQNTKPTFDPMLGFPNGRKPRVMTASAEEFESLQIQPAYRGYCGREIVDLKVCTYNYPWFFGAHMCGHERHALESCQVEDYKLRMKEWERERRLRIRQKKIDAAAAADAAEEMDE